MADRTTIARPYAKAAFAQAQRAGRLGEWSEGLRVAAAVVSDERVAALLDNPHMTTAGLTGIVLGVAGPYLDDTGRNFIHALAENRRLGYLPEVAALFETMRDAAEGWVDVTVTSAVELSAEQQDSLAAALARKLNRKVRIHGSVDPSLIGGAVLRAGDLVIDGSVRARLESMAYQLTA
jgi:F-type H+-transporting ATPase subunit delta